MFEVNFLRFNWRWLSKQVNYLIDKPFELDRTMVHRTGSCLNWTNFYLWVYRVGRTVYPVRYGLGTTESGKFGWGEMVAHHGGYGEFSLYNFDMYKTRLDSNSSHFFYFTLILFWSKIKFQKFLGHGQFLMVEWTLSVWQTMIPIQKMPKIPKFCLEW